mgnify:CR=1 FL=1
MSFDGKLINSYTLNPYKDSYFKGFEIITCREISDYEGGTIIEEVRTAEELLVIQQEAEIKSLTYKHDKYQRERLIDFNAYLQKIKDYKNFKELEKQAREVYEDDTTTATHNFNATLTQLNEKQSTETARFNEDALDKENDAFSKHRKQVISHMIELYDEQKILKDQLLLDELERDLGSDQYGSVAYNRGVGSFLNHARNQLKANVLNFYHTGDLVNNNQKTSWGIKLQGEQVQNKIKEWNYLDSSRFNSPRPVDSIGYQNPSNIQYQELELSKFIKANNEISSSRITGFAQHRYKFNKEKNTHFIHKVPFYYTMLEFLSNDEKPLSGILTQNSAVCNVLPCITFIL